MLNQNVNLSFAKVALLTFFLTTSGASYASALTSNVNQFDGQWRVVSVRIDAFATTHTAITVDDPHYVGRKMVLNKDVISGNLDETVNCSAVHYEAQGKTALDNLLQQTSGKRYSEPLLPKAKDFGLDAQTVTPVSVTCQSGKFGPDGEHIGNWIALLSSDTLITNWYDNSYLIMKRIKPTDTFSPSFPCDANLNQTEKTICDNDELAAWDKSVDKAFKTALWQQQAIMPDDKAALRKIKSEQTAWLKKRNQCQNNTGCIARAMKDRVDTLTQ
ncbi:hypothetical protein GCM10011513_17020 [Franconibacter daqui]|uniref:lysozyme inhibitor LprI family protein n=1 Tax=Franconibacter daqui TaxID=2047724 RepID=UPI00166ACEFE|nr:lysozyme inhibitor LprI family protein [Franconibacter daqui]GGD20127.1 hypothetical protein GCM10011513_17020 [Franconibacter daqui]